MHGILQQCNKGAIVSLMSMSVCFKIQVQEGQMKTFATIPNQHNAELDDVLCASCKKEDALIQPRPGRVLGCIRSCQSPATYTPYVGTKLAVWKVQGWRGCWNAAMF